MRAQPHASLVDTHQSIGGKPLCDVQRWSNPLAPKLLFERRRIDSSVQAQTQEPCLFVLAIEREPRRLRRLTFLEISLQVVAGLRSQNVAVAGFQRR